MVKKTLADNAARAKPDCLLVRSGKKFLNNLRKLHRLRTNFFFDQSVERAGRLNHFAQHHFAVMRRRAFIENAPKKRSDERLELLFGGSVWLHTVIRRKFLKRVFLRPPKHFEIE